MEHSRTACVLAAQMRRIGARAVASLLGNKNGWRAVFRLPALLLALTFGVYAPLICILHCHFGWLRSPAAARDHRYHYLCHSADDQNHPDLLAVAPVLPQPVYPLVTPLTVLAITVPLLLRCFYLPLARLPQQWVAIPLVPPPRGC